MIFFRAKHLICLLLGCGTMLVLTACGNSGIDELQRWMTGVRSHAKVGVTPLIEPKKFIPFVYADTARVDPYNPNKLLVALAKLHDSSTGLKPNLDRRREPLENYPLDMIKMVGTLQKTGLSYVVLQVDKTVFQAKVGNYIGQNFGMITAITESEVALKEIIEDASGEWVERNAKLVLQENGK